MGRKSNLTLRKKLKIIKEHETKRTPYSVRARRSGVCFTADKYTVRDKTSRWKEENMNGEK